MTMGLRKIVDEITGHILETGVYACSIRFSAEDVDPGDYRVRLFYQYDGTNDLSSATGIGLYAMSSNPCDRISYDDWNGVFRRPYNDTTGLPHDASFNVEVACEFSGDTLEHEISFVNYAGIPVKLGGESVLNGTFRDGNLPVNILLETRDRVARILSATYDPGTGIVTVETDGPHRFADGDAISITGFPTTDHACGVNGERYNGTYRITVTGDNTFSYKTRFYDNFADANMSYSNCEHVVATRWITCEYSVDRQVFPGVAEALIVWPAHTFSDRDRITLANGNFIVAKNAIIERPAPNSFVCRSLSIDDTSAITTIVYAPRTPISNVPANYAPATTGFFMGGSFRLTGSNDVNNSSTRVNTTAPPVYPFKYGSFDLDNPDVGGAITDGTMRVGSGKFGVITFMPPGPLDHLAGNQFSIYVKVKNSTEVATELCISQMTDSSWTVSNNADYVYSMVYKVPLDKTEIKSDTTDEQTCNYQYTDPFVFRVPVSLSDKWCLTGLPVSLAFTLYGRNGAVLELDTDTNGDAFKVILSRSEDQGDVVPIPVKVTPSLASAGDTVSIMVTDKNTSIFDAPISNYRVKLGDETDPSKWFPVTTNNGSTLTFTMPEGYSGNTNLVVMEKPSAYGWDSEDVHERTVPVVIDARVEVLKVKKLNERLKPGVIDSKVSRTASYNRDFGYKGFVEITDENSMIQNLYSCLLTRKGERLFNPEFGTTIEERIFSLRTGGNPTDILKECITALETYEPRIQLVYEHCNITDMGQHGIYLTLGVIVPGGTVQTIDIPFKNRGRLV
jgi:phage baseplate assembly protein W